MKLNKKKGIILASSVISLILIGVLFVIYETGPYDKNNGQDIVVDIPMGSTIGNIADILKENNLIKNKFIFEINFKLRNNYSNLKSGKYLLNQSLSNSDIINKLASGEMYQDGIKITIPEGSTSNEIISSIGRDISIWQQENLRMLLKDMKREEIAKNFNGIAKCNSLFWEVSNEKENVLNFKNIKNQVKVTFY